MAKLIKIQVKDVGKLEFSLVEDAKQGDYISLSKINEIDFSALQQQLSDINNEYVSSIVTKRLNEEKKNIINEYKLSLEYKSLEKQIIELEKNLSLKDNELKSFEDKIKNQFKNSDEYKDLENLINETKEKNIQLTFQLESQKNKLKNEIETYKLKEENKYLQEKEEINKQHRKEIDELKEQLESLRRDKISNSKVVGEELEQWILEQYDNALGTIEDCQIEKITKAQEGTKADFLFKVFSNNKILGSVTIEAKTQIDFDKTKTLNSSHFLKLEKDRSKQNSDFALLVTELEPEDKFTIKKVNGYTNMYMCRPSALIPFLSMVRLIYKKREELLTDKGVINFEEKEKILNNFDQMKDDILNNQIQKMNKSLETIKDKSEKIQTLALGIMEESSKVIDSFINQLRNKIENFKIKKITKDIEKVE